MGDPISLNLPTLASKQQSLKMATRVTTSQFCWKFSSFLKDGLPSLGGV